MPKSGTPAEAPSCVSHAMDSIGAALEPLLGSWPALAALTALSTLSLAFVVRDARRGDLTRLRLWQNANVAFIALATIFIYVDIDRIDSGRWLQTFLLLSLGLAGVAAGHVLKRRFGPKPYRPEDGEQAVVEVLHTERGIADAYAVETVGEQEGVIIVHQED